MEKRKAMAERKAMDSRKQRLEDALDTIAAEVRRARSADRRLTPRERKSLRNLKHAGLLIRAAMLLLGDDDTDDW